MLSEALLNLGRIHWYLVHAASHMDAKRFEYHPSGEFHKASKNPFGYEVGMDEIHWWVYKNEHDIPTLKKKTEITKDTVSNLYHAATEIRLASLPSLKLLSQAYETFAKTHKKDILIILDFVKWLYGRNELAPTILFNFSTWGSTRKADREITILEDDLENPDALEKLTLIVLGFFRCGWLTIDKVRAEMQVELFDNQDTHYATNKDELTVSEDLVESKTVDYVAYEFEEYLERLRLSLRNIGVEIANRESQERLITSDDFWRLFIGKAAHSKKTEQKYWDFKETLDMWHIKNKTQRDEVANKFAEIVGGFGNNQGGVIIVGVTNAIPRRIVGLSGTPAEIENYIKTIPHMIQQYVSYDKNFFYLHQVNIPDENGDMKLCLVIAIEQTCDVLSVKKLDNKSFSYPFREETGTVYKDWHSIQDNKTSVKSDSYNFITVLQQFVYEEI